MPSSRGIRIAGAALLCSALGGSALAASPRSEALRPGSSFEPRVELLVLPLGAPPAGLTYEPSDVGAEADRAPRPIAYDARYGLYLVDPGPATAPEPTLQRFGVDGKRMFRSRLLPLVRAAEPAPLVSHQLFLGPAGESFLLYSTGDDAATGREKDFGLASFDASGKETARVELAGFGWTDRVDRALDGTLWAFRAGASDPTGEWTAHDPAGTKRFSVAGSRQGVALADGRLLLVDAGAAHRRSARILDTRRRREQVEVRGELELGDEMVPGTGDFIATLSPESAGALDPPQLWLATSRLELLRVSTRGGTSRVEVVGSQPVRITWSEQDAKGSVERFELVNPQWAHLDASGDLYLVARRGPKNPAIVVYRMALRKDVRDRLAPAGGAR